MPLEAIKKLLKSSLPDAVLRRIRRGSRQGGSSYRETPRFTVPPGQERSVLNCCIAYTESGGFCVPLSSRHRPAAQKILNGSVYEPDTIEFLRSHCGAGDIVHAGTYFGDFLPELSRSCTSENIIWAFEPNKENFTCAKITCAINGLSNVELVNAALGARQDAAAMFTRDQQGRALGGASTLVAEDCSRFSDATEEVRIVSLDDSLPENRTISIIQLDVEGYEEPALAGALKTIARCLPILVLETLPGDAWLSDNIFRLGYTLGDKVHTNRVLRPPASSPNAPSISQ